MAEKRTVTVEIAGAKYRMSSDAEDGHLQRLADLVNHRVEELGPRAARSATSAHLLALVCLGLADELLEADARRARMERKAREALTAALAIIDERLEATPRDE